MNVVDRLGQGGAANQQKNLKSALRRHGLFSIAFSNYIDTIALSGGRHLNMTSGGINITDSNHKIIKSVLTGIYPGKSSMYPCKNGVLISCTAKGSSLSTTHGAYLVFYSYETDEFQEIKSKLHTDYSVYAYMGICWNDKLIWGTLYQVCCRWMRKLPSGMMYSVTASTLHSSCGSLHSSM